MALLPSIVFARSVCVTPTTANSPNGTPTREIAVEHPFGSIKQWPRRGTLPMRGIGDARRELSPVPLICNLRRALNILAVGP